MELSERFDVIIIGTGAGGGTLARSLAPSGKRILLLERGGFIPREAENWDPDAVFLRSRYRPAELWLDDFGVERRCPTYYCVGGNTKFYGAALTRFREADFERVLHPGGPSPPWPLSYADFEPFYSRAEEMYAVHGTRGLDPTEPRASRPYPHPAVSQEPRIQQLAADLRAEGLYPFPLPLGVLLDEARPQESRCIRCATCGGFPCRLHAKADAEVMGVRPALEHSAVSLVTGANAVRLQTSASGREVTGVEVEREGAREIYRGDIVVMACGAINSAALLLRSACEQHPHGLANGSGVVGRFYMRHLTSSLIGLSRETNTTVFQKTLGCNDFYLGGEREPEPLGHVQTLGRCHPGMLAAEGVPVPSGMTLPEVAHRALELAVFTEDLPDANNRVTIERDGRIRVCYSPNNLGAHERLYGIVAEMLPRLGCDGRLDTTSVYVGQRGGIDNANHQCGTVRFGDDPKTSALDEFCKAHELDNLYVVDASFFPSSTAMNPALTVMANALRVGDHLLHRLCATLPRPTTEGAQ
jgi:choline dehydrogenase-like flavoprotein